MRTNPEAMTRHELQREIKEQHAYIEDNYEFLPEANIQEAANWLQELYDELDSRPHPGHTIFVYTRRPLPERTF